MKNEEQILHTPEGVRDIYGSEFVQKFELQQQLYHLLAGEGYQELRLRPLNFLTYFPERSEPCLPKSFINSLTGREIP